MTDVFIGRRPVLDRDLEVYAYELVYKYDPGLTRAEGTSALVNRILDHGFEDVASNHRILLRVGRSTLMGSVLERLPLDQLIVDVLDESGIDDALAERVAELHGKGIRVMIPDYVEQDMYRLLTEVADIVKVDVSTFDGSKARARALTLKQKAGLLMAENVETRALHQQYEQAGFDLFQGYFLTQPDVLSGEIPTNRLATLQLIAALQDPEVDIDEIEKAVQQNVALSYAILRYVNSAYVGLRQRVESIRQAIVLLGPPTVRQIASVAMVSELDDRPPEVMKAALARAKMCEGIARHIRESPGTFYTAGLFSALDALTEAPLEDLLAELPLTEEVVAAILRQEGPIGQAVEVSKAYERFDWSDPAFRAYDPVMLSEVYLEALTWADQALAGGDLGASASSR